MTGLNFLRILLACINGVFLFIGVVFLAFGVWMKAEGDNTVYLSYISPEDVIIIPISMIVIGTFILIITAIGFYGIYRLQRVWLCVYVFLLTVILLMQAVPLIMVFVSKEALKRKLVNSFKKRIQLLYGVNEDTKRFDLLQKKGKCCGAENFMDWFNSTWWRNQSESGGPVVPGSCCKPQTNVTKCNMGTPMRTDVLDHKKIYTMGCATAIFKKLAKYTKTIVVVVCTVFGIQFISVIGSCLLLSTLESRVKAPEPLPKL